MKQLTWLTAFLWLACSRALPQENTSPFDLTRPTAVTAPSANVAALMRVSDIPVSYYTGKANIAVPLYEVKTGFIKLPITAAYNASGMMVEEEAGLIGGGWSLNVGGSIARAAAATPDEGYGGHRGYRFSAAHYSLPVFPTDPEGNSWYSSLTDCNQKELVEGTSYDLAPDVYYLNFNGHSAKVYFDKNGSPLISPYRAWKISGHDSVGFRVTIEDGTIYVFDLAEVSTMDSWSTTDDYPSFTIPTKTNWFLTKIISANLADTVKFTYTSVSYNEYNKNQDETQANFKVGQTQFSCNAPSELTHYTRIFYNRAVATYLLSSIETRVEKIDFYMHTGRRDVNDTIGLPYKLDSFRVVSKLRAGALPVKDVHFIYSYFGDSSASSALTRRLKLDAIREFSSTHADSLAHWFTYKSPTLVPDRSTKAQDHWGYYNGGGANSTLIPAYDDHRGNVYTGANREPDSAYAGIGILTAIRYPTGGTTSFEYEMNDYSYSNKGYVNLHGQLDSSVYTHTETVNTNGLSGSGTVEKRDTIYVPDGIGFDDHNCSVTYRINGPNNSDPNADVYILNENGTEIWSRVVSYGNFVTEPLTLTPAHYYVLVARRYSSSYSASIRVDFPDWQQLPQPAVYSKLAGGMRIKRMVQYDGISHTNDKIKRFSYLLNDTTSSGYLFQLPVYEDYTYKPVYCNQSGVTGTVKVGDYIYFTRHSTSMIPLGRTQGAFIGYSRVTVLEGDSAENGRVEYTFNTLPRDQGGVGYPYIPMSSRDDLRGLQQTQMVFDSSGNLLEKITNTYDLHDTLGDPNYKWILGYKVGALRRDNQFELNGCPTDHSWTFRGATYKLYQHWPVLVQSTDSNFVPTTGRKIGIINLYDYDTTNLLIKRQRSLTSTGDTLTTTFTYPQDYAGTAVYDSMIARHIWAKGIQKATFLSGRPLSKETRNYDFWSNNLIAIHTTNGQKGTGPNEAREQFHGYDKFQNLQGQSKVNDMRAAYLYDYASQYVTAMAINADTASIAYTSFEADGDGGWFTLSSLRVDSAITGRKSYNLANGSVSKLGLINGNTYKLSYWSKNGMYTVSGGTSSFTASKTVNGWTYYEYLFTPSSNIATIAGIGLIDEVRLYPADAQMTTYTYEPLVGVTTVTDQNSVITYYEYDGFGRLKFVRDQDYNIVKEHKYNYANTVAQ